MIANTLKKVALGSEDLSQFAVQFRKTLSEPNHRGNVAVFEYLDTNGVLIKKAFTTEIGIGTHAEQIAKNWFEKNGISNNSVKRIYSELEPCSLETSNCKIMLEKNFFSAQKSFSYDYPGNSTAPAEIIAKRRESLNQRFEALINLLK
ncbi:nucleic acid/nucleotide deaminase domain-containing protein [Flavobacterium ginsenosidimutans]|uniref:nucleic acid/nucleotide deaminase domain-containing protein n=1 Tax=Flavobacterium ginsenosidimutans TaxID=687844 RepID=UPI000DABEA2F|nr:nucleic acid/nucleotide deaminase domain-containing protein [Flavobacterium ginsenosidimutans]KAF2326490.1 hypothetical protein DM444_21605 [Flavobacterium ginsenosidimutans]